MRGFRPFLCLRNGQIFVSSGSVRKMCRSYVRRFVCSHLPDNQNVFEGVRDEELVRSEVEFQFDGEHDDFDGLLPLDG